MIATVTEERRTTLTGLPVPWPAADDSTTSAGEKPGVDLSALLQLLGDCGGHLWVTAEPTGMDRFADALLLGQLSEILPALVRDEP